MKRIFLNLAILSFFSGFMFSAAKATELTGESGYQETTNKDNGILTTTKENKNIEEGKIISFTLKNKEIPENELAVEFNAIVKCLEKEFNLQNNKKLEDVIKNASVSSGFGNKKIVSFEILMNKEIKDQLKDFLKNNFDEEDIEKTKKSLKEIINNNFEKISLDNVENRVIEKIDREIEQQKSSNSFESFFDFFKNSQEKEIEKQVREKMVKKLEEEKNKITKYKNEITKENLKSFVDLVESVNLNGNFKRSGFSMSKVSTNVEQ